jgi:hypothetical protein
MDIQSIAPAHFREGDGLETIVLIEQSHRQELRDGIRDYWAELTIQRDTEQTTLVLDAKEGRKEAVSYISLTVAQVRQLSEYLLKAAQDAEDYIKYAATQK